MTPDEFFEGFEASRRLFEEIRGAVEAAGPCTIRVTKSQIAFVRARPFAWVWVPGRYLGPGHAPLVLSLALRRRDDSVLWKQVVEPSLGRFMHHLDVWGAADVQGVVPKRLREAWDEAGQTAGQAAGEDAPSVL